MELTTLHEYGAALIAELRGAPAEDAEARAAVAERAANILRPAGALARLDDLAVWIAAWQRTTTPVIDRPAAVIFAGDHGVVAEGVSAYPADVTAAMVDTFAEGVASVSAIAAVVGATVHVVDVGVGRPTGNLRIEPALTPERFIECFEAGRTAVRELDAELLVVGEMGIGNTTAAAAVCSALLGDSHPADIFTGPGTGVDATALANKRRVVADGVARLGADRHPLSVLCEVGGTELVAMAGAYAEARLRSLPVLLDGYIATAAALALHRLDADFLANARAGHRSSEPGHRAVLDHLELSPLLDLDLRLGEASGALAATPLVQMGCRLVTHVPTFEERFGSDTP